MKMELFDRDTVEAQNGRLDIQPRHVALFFPAGGTLALQTDVAGPRRYPDHKSHDWPWRP